MWNTTLTACICGGLAVADQFDVDPMVSFPLALLIGLAIAQWVRKRGDSHGRG